jgi:hypothetical protein
MLAGVAINLKVRGSSEIEVGETKTGMTTRSMPHMQPPKNLHRYLR